MTIQTIPRRGGLSTPAAPSRPTRAASDRPSIVGLLAMLMFAIGCGRTFPTGSRNDLVLLASDAGAECLQNGDCGEADICLDRACVHFGECLRDFHCGTTLGCVENQCVGDWPEVLTGDPISCEINADCPDHHFCVNATCSFGVECLTHAHCEVGKACVGRLCVNAL
jgi:hypothetical protein